jgi:hypothetical protein
MPNAAQHTRFFGLVYHTTPCSAIAGSVIACLYFARQGPYFQGALGQSKPLDIVADKTVKANGRSPSFPARKMQGFPAFIL